MCSSSEMKVLHVACIGNSPFSGVSVAAPLHANYQAKYCNAAFFNVNGEAIDSSNCQILIGCQFDIERVVEQFGLPDLVVFHEVYRAPYLKIARALRSEGVPYVVIPHGELSVSSQKKKPLKKKVANIALFNRFIEGALAIQCLSEGEMRNTHFGRCKFIGTNGVTLPTAFEKCQAPGIEILYIGRLEVEIKGIDLMLDAVSLSRELMADKNVTLSIYGPDYCGRYARVKEMIAERGIGDLVNLHHEVVGSEKEMLLRRADLFMQTSRTEGMPLGILEAMAYGVPCLITQGTQLGPFVELHGAGWVAETGVSSVSGLLEAAVLAGREERLCRGKRARHAVEQEFEWGRVARSALDWYERLLSADDTAVKMREMQ